MKSVLVKILIAGLLIMSMFSCSEDKKNPTEPDGNKLPECNINSPANGTEYALGSTINVEATATDSDGSINKVEFYIGTDLRETVFESPYSAQISTDGLSLGKNIIKVIAIDNEDGKKESTIDIKLVNGNIPPSCTITSPANNSTVQIGDVISIEVDAIKGDGEIYKVEFYFDNSLIYTEYAAPYKYDYATEGIDEGTYIIKAKAYDDNQETAEHSITINLEEPVPANFEIEWERREPSEWGSWRSTAASGNGQFIYAAAYGNQDGRLFISGDKGEQWLELMPAGDFSKKWNSIAVCYTGQNIIVGEAPGRLYHSTDYGQNWAELTLLGDEDKHWKSAAMSDDGSVIVVTTYEKVFVSNNGGVDWDVKLQAQYESFVSSAISKDGQDIFVARYDHRIFKSNDSGENWTELGGAGSSSWRSLESSTDGNILLACSNTQILISKNQGTTWTDIKPQGTTDFYAASMSDDGKMIILVEMNGKVRVSGNGGISWEAQNLIPSTSGGFADGKWTNPFVSRDASLCLVPEAFYKLFIGEVTWLK